MQCTKPRPSSWYPLAQENVTSAFIGMTVSLANTLPLLVVTMAVPCSGSDTGVHVTSGGEKVTTGRVNYLTLT